MNDDRELLELAAKAAGMKSAFTEWTPMTNPLTYDGDAFQLAVKLGLWVHCGKFHVAIDGTHIEEACGNDPYAATRRAIVRAAAEIGRTM